MKVVVFWGFFFFCFVFLYGVSNKSSGGHFKPWIDVCSHLVFTILNVKKALRIWPSVYTLSCLGRNDDLLHPKTVDYLEKLLLIISTFIYFLYESKYAIHNHCATRSS